LLLDSSLTLQLARLLVQSVLVALHQLAVRLLPYLPLEKKRAPVLEPPLTGLLFGGPPLEHLGPPWFQQLLGCHLMN
ncbi:hypothetical protein, partial [Escherichia coli]|uniref:hypothetical protein n=1 Tax=Escherichia coli TaxID=562 RepID=UPI003CEE51E6